MRFITAPLFLLLACDVIGSPDPFEPRSGERVIDSIREDVEGPGTVWALDLDPNQIVIGTTHVVIADKGRGDVPRHRSQVIDFSAYRMKTNASRMILDLRERDGTAGGATVEFVAVGQTLELECNTDANPDGYRVFGWVEYMTEVTR